ncbi:hypothetical protein D3C85_939300 [compost metagenome]
MKEQMPHLMMHQVKKTDSLLEHAFGGKQKTGVMTEKLYINLEMLGIKTSVPGQHLSMQDIGLIP